MADLYVGLVVIAFLATATFILFRALASRCSRWVSDCLGLLVVASLFAFIRFAWYQTRLTSFLPYSNLIIVGNWFPIAGAAMAGLASSRVPGSFWRRAGCVCGLLGATSYSLIWPFLGTSPRCADVWSVDGICLQTTPQTCTPASAATLLRLHGISATEQEMAELCLTREGTTWQGLYRGLKRKTAGTDWEVEILQCGAAELLALSDQPLLLTVGLPDDPASSDPMAAAEWGWKPGVGHSVVALRRSPVGRLVVADPAPGIGREEWTKDDVHYLFRGTAMRLVRHTASSQP